MNSRLLVLVLVALGASGWQAQAQWGSIHGNNHGYSGERGGSHGGGGGAYHGQGPQWSTTKRRRPTLSPTDMWSMKRGSLRLL